MAAELQNELAALLTRYAPSQRAALPSFRRKLWRNSNPLVTLRRNRAAKWTNSGLDPKDRFAEFTLYQNAFEDFLRRTHRRGHAEVSVDPEIRSAEHPGAIPSG